MRQAMIATPTVRKRYAEQIRRRAEERQLEVERKSSAATAISGKTVKFERKATKTGKLYAAITEKNIAEALKKEHNIEIDIKISMDETVAHANDVSPWNGR